MISGNFAEFDRQLERIQVDMLPDLYSKVVRKVAFDGFALLIRGTPRDTGRAQFGWDLTVIQASTFVPPLGARSYPANDIARALGVLRTLQFGDDVWICNNVIYIQRLNEGHSKQKPAGFVEDAMQSMQLALERAFAAWLST